MSKKERELAAKMAVKKMIDAVRDLVITGANPQFITEFQLENLLDGRKLGFRLTLERNVEMTDNDDHIPDGYSKENEHSADMKRFVDDVDSGIAPDKAGRQDFDIETF